MNEKKQKRLWKTVFPVGAILIPGLLWCGMGWLLPEKLTLMEGQALEIQSKLPISAKTEDSVGVLGIKTEPLADQLHLELGTSITAEPKKAGSTEVTFYLCDALPLKTVQAEVLPKTELIPVGCTVGVTMDTKGLLVLGTGFVSGESNQVFEPCKGVLKIGDRILRANGQELENKEAFLRAVENSGGKPMTLLLERKGAEQQVEIRPAFSTADKAYRLGIWIRDSIQGIGTVTYYDPETEAFGALGHGVYDVDTGELMVIQEGALLSSDLKEVKKGAKGQPGELTGTVDMNEKLGKIDKNTEIGIYGKTKKASWTKEQAYPIASLREVQRGEATILSDLEGEGVKEYSIRIEAVNEGGGKNHKDMTLRITDPKLLKETGGIVQGMSGSPILQNGKLIGAVTYVMVNDPSRGFGTGIEAMLQAQNS